MYVLNITTNDYDNETDSDTTNDYNNITNNCTDTENIIDIIIPSLLLTIPCGLLFLCLISLMIYTLIKPFFNNKC